MFAIVTNPGKAGAWLHCVRKRCKGTFLIHVRKLFKRSCDNVGSETAQGSPWNCSHRASSIDIGWANFEHYLCTSFQCSSRLAFCIVKKSVSMTSVELRYSVAQRAIERFAKHFASEAVIHGLRCEARRWQCNDWISRQTVAKGVTSNSGGDSKIVWQGPAPIIRISWKNCLPHAVSIFQSIGGRIFRPT